MQAQLPVSAITGGNLIGDYYPTPCAIGLLNETFDPYWGAIDAMRNDEEIAADLELRRASALQVPYKWEGSAADIAFAQQALELVGLDNLLRSCLYHAEQGFNPLEVDWLTDGSHALPVAVERRHPKQFRIAADKPRYGLGNNLLFSAQGIGFQPVTMGKVIPVVRQSTRERPYGVSVLEPAWPAWQTKWTNVEQLERLGYKYSVPSVVALTTATDEAALASVSISLTALESGGSAALSGVTDVKTLTASGKISEILDVVKFWDQKLCKLITGQTLTGTSQQYGSRSLGEVHERAALRIVVDDAQTVFSALNRTLLRWVFAFNQRSGQARIVFDKDAFESFIKTSQSGHSAPTPRPVTLSSLPARERMLCL